jgi:hypothetical protein
MKLTKVLFTSMLLLCCVGAHAQWQWTDSEGRKVFSDRPPPVDVPDKNIIARPTNRVPAQPVVPLEGVAEVSPPRGAAVAAAALPKVDGFDKALEAKKKQLADAEAAKKKLDDDRILRARIENCARAKQAKATFDLGGRIVRANQAGEREVMDDATRANEIKRIQGIIDSDCR